MVLRGVSFIALGNMTTMYSRPNLGRRLNLGVFLIQADIRALITRLGFWGPLYYIYKKEP